MPRPLTADESEPYRTGGASGTAACLPWAFAQQGLFTDVVVEAHGICVDAHRAVIAARSRVLLSRLVGVCGEDVQESPPLDDAAPPAPEAAEGASAAKLEQARDGDNVGSGTSVSDRGTDQVVALPVARLKLDDELCPVALAPHLPRVLQVLYEGWDASDVGLDLDALIAVLVVLPRLGCDTLADAIAESTVASLDTSVEDCLLVLDRAAALSCLEHDAEDQPSDSSVPVAVSAALHQVTAHAFDVVRFMLRAAIGAVPTNDVLSLSLEHVVPPVTNGPADVSSSAHDVTTDAVGSELSVNAAPVAQSQAAVLQPTPAERLRSLTSPIRFTPVPALSQQHGGRRATQRRRASQGADTPPRRLSQQARAMQSEAAPSPSQHSAPEQFAATPAAFIHACVEMIPIGVVVEAVLSWAATIPTNHDESDAEDSTVAVAEARQKRAALACFLLLRMGHFNAQRILLQSAATASSTTGPRTAGDGDVEPTSSSSSGLGPLLRHLPQLAPLVETVANAVAIPLFSVASVVLAQSETGSSTASVASALARQCLISAAEEPGSFSTTWVQHVAMTHRNDTTAKARGSGLGQHASQVRPSVPIVQAAPNAAVADRARAKRARDGVAATGVSVPLLASTSTSGTTASSSLQEGVLGNNKTAAVGRRGGAAAAAETAPLMPDSEPTEDDEVLPPPVPPADGGALAALAARVADARDATAASIGDLEARISNRSAELHRRVDETAREVCETRRKLHRTEEQIVAWRSSAETELAKAHGDLCSATRAFSSALEGLYAFEDELTGTVLPQLRQQQDETFWELKTSLESEVRRLDRQTVADGHASPLRRITALLHGVQQSAQPAAAAAGPASSASSKQQPVAPAVEAGQAKGTPQATSGPVDPGTSLAGPSAVSATREPVADSATGSTTADIASRDTQHQ